jgi:hypothetical protein
VTAKDSVSYLVDRKKLVNIGFQEEKDSTYTNGELVANANILMRSTA